MVDTRYNDIIYKSRFDAEHQARHNSHIFSNSGLYKPSLSKDLPKDAMVEDMNDAISCTTSSYVSLDRVDNSSCIADWWIKLARCDGTTTTGEEDDEEEDVDMPSMSCCNSRIDALSRQTRTSFSGLGRRPTGSDDIALLLSSLLFCDCRYDGEWGCVVNVFGGWRGTVYVVYEGDRSQAMGGAPWAMANGLGCARSGGVGTMGWGEGE